MPEAPPDEPGLLASSLTTLRLIVGWAGVALAVLNLAMGFANASYVVFHLVLLAAGLVLLGLGKVGRRPGRAAWRAGVLTGAAGLVATALPPIAVECCSRGYAERHGFPFTMVARYPGWRLDPGRTVVDLIFWACVALLVVTVLAWLRPRPERTHRPAPVRTSPARPATHAEERGARARAADEENVGGLP